MTTNVTVKKSALAAVEAPVAAMARKLSVSLLDWRRRRRDRRYLLALDDRLLRDIGLTQADVMSHYSNVRFPQSWRSTR